jgi:hypothetical protein
VNPEGSGFGRICSLLDLPDGPDRPDGLDWPDGPDELDGLNKLGPGPLCGISCPSGG